MQMESYLYYSSPTNVTFINNTVSLSGGAIYVVTPIPSIYYAMACFYQYNGTFRNNKLLTLMCILKVILI